MIHDHHFPPSPYLAGPAAELVLTAALAALGGSEAGLKLCRMMMDESAVTAATMPPEIMSTFAGDLPHGLVRASARHLIADLCSGCGMCPRGRSI